MVWADLSGTALRVSARVNHSLTAVPDRADASESAPTSGRIYLFGGDDGQSPRNDCWVYDVARDDAPACASRRPSPISKSGSCIGLQRRCQSIPALTWSSNLQKCQHVALCWSSTPA